MDIKDFHINYEKNRTWENTSWLGIPCWKYPTDAWVVQEIITSYNVDYIIETGTGLGGSSLFYASIMELLGTCGQIITVDIENKVNLGFNYNILKLWNKRINQIIGSSIDNAIVNEITSLVKNKKILLILDSWHSKEHVLKELELYSPLIKINEWIIVEDTHVNGHPVPWDWEDGPYEAVNDFLENNNNFERIRYCERHGVTFNPGGWLRRVS